MDKYAAKYIFKEGNPLSFYLGISPTELQAYMCRAFSLNERLKIYFDTFFGDQNGIRMFKNCKRQKTKFQSTHQSRRRRLDQFLKIKFQMYRQMSVLYDYNFLFRTPLLSSVCLHIFLSTSHLHPVSKFKHSSRVQRRSDLALNGNLLNSGKCFWYQTSCGNRPRVRILLNIYVHGA